MSNKASNIRQHPPLRVPQGWASQETAFVVALEKLLDDLYWKAGKTLEAISVLQSKTEDLDARVAALEGDEET